jgi:site-specific DNA-methyltransferase (adenine-specific)
MQTVADYGKKYGFMNSYPIFFIKNYSAQVLKANMKIVGATEQAIVLERNEKSEDNIMVDGVEFAAVLYRDKLPKLNNGRHIGENGKPIRGTGKMIFNWFEWEKDGKEIPKIHPNQKPVNVLKNLIEIFTDEGDIVIDPVAGSGTTLRAAYELNRNSYGFEVYRKFYNEANEKMLNFDFMEPTLINMA